MLFRSEAVRIAEISERVLIDFRMAAADIEMNRSLYRRRRLSSDLSFQLITKGFAIGAVFYLFAFRITVPATAIALVFGAGVFLAAALDFIVYQSLLKPVLSLVSMEHHAVVPWALLALLNVIGAKATNLDEVPILSVGILSTMPMFCLYRWIRRRRRGQSSSGAPPAMEARS